MHMMFICFTFVIANSSIFFLTKFQITERVYTVRLSIYAWTTVNMIYMKQDDHYNDHHLAKSDSEFYVLGNLIGFSTCRISEDISK